MAATLDGLRPHVEGEVIGQPQHHAEPLTEALRVQIITHRLIAVTDRATHERAQRCA